MAIKTLTITVTEIQRQPLRLWKEGDYLYYQQDYVFVSNGLPIPLMQKASSINGRMAWVDVPASIKTALAEVDTFVNNGIYAQEGLTLPV